MRTPHRLSSLINTKKIMIKIKWYNSITVFFGCLNLIIYRRSVSDHEIPLHFVIASILALVLVLITANTRIHRQVLLEKNASFKKYFSFLTMAESIAFLVISYVPFFLDLSGTSKGVWRKVVYVIIPHLYTIQVQVGLESILMSNKRHGALFRFIVATNAYRGIAMTTCIRRYVQMRTDLIASLSSEVVALLDAYMAGSTFVYIASNVVIAKLWYPSLKFGDDLTAGGLRTFKDSVCIITGAASGIGRQMVLELGTRGAHAVILMDMQVSLAEDVAAILNSKGVASSVYKVDVRDFASVQNAVNETMEKYGRLDYMINNAGILVIGPIERLGDDFNYILDVNVRGVHNGVQAAYPVMKSQGFGHIVNVSSLLGLIPGGQWAVAYGASKHAVVGLSTNLRIEAAKHGIRVSCFCPGTIKTPIHTGGVYGKNLTGIPPEIWNAQVSKMEAMDAKKCASMALDKIANNEALFVVPSRPLFVTRLLYRLCPSLWLYYKIHKKDWRRNLIKSKESEQCSDHHKVKEQ